MREDMRAQGYPEWVVFRLEIPEGYQRKMIGNGINVHVLRAILKQMWGPEPVHGPVQKSM